MHRGQGRKSRRDKKGECTEEQLGPLTRDGRTLTSWPETLLGYAVGLLAAAGTCHGGALVHVRCARGHVSPVCW